uniref:Uncharacterized protein n=1 Tax=Anguilla anguilla TaxID=7936 RepID=A0A0E9RFX6_ANGAN
MLETPTSKHVSTVSYLLVIFVRRHC